MKKIQLTALVLALGGASCVSAESSVSIYGILDTAIEHASASNGVQATVMKQTGHVPSRLGFRGVEDLGGGMRASFELESGLAVDSGSLLQGGRLFGREAYVSLGSTDAGDIRVGRQLSAMQNIAYYDPDHFSPYSPALAMQLSNLEQTAQDNVISYWSPKFGNFSGMAALALGENAAVTSNLGAPQVVGPGTAKNSHEAMLAYEDNALSGAITYQDGGQNLTAGGDANQRMIALATLYKMANWDVGGVYWSERNALSNGKNPTTNLWTVGAAWKISPAVRLVAQVGRASDNGLSYATGTTKAVGRNNYLNLGADYNLSKRTHIYFRVGRVSDTNNGFNGRVPLASTPLRESAPLTTNGSSRGALVGFRIRF